MSISYLDVSFANVTAEECFGLQPSSAQVACSAQHLNITDPPSYYSFEEYPFLWEPITCMLSNVSYHNRIDIPDNFNWCTIPLKGSDAFLFVSLALIIAACLFGKLSAVWVLVAGGVVGAVNNYVNLLQISSGIAIWLGISPPDLFFYAFLPPLLVDSAIRIDFFMFSKLWVHILSMAFVMVILSAIILTPLILFVLGFASRGFSWVHGALFAAMIASTDALAATAILKQGGGPEKLVVLMEGEALLNDASAITLFEVFMHILEDHPGASDMPTVWSAIPIIIEEILKLASIGAAVGWGMSVATGYLLRWLRWRGAKPAVEITIILAVAYLSFYVGQSPAQGSGVISVVVYGLWGNYTSKWGMLASTEESGSFDAFWDTLSFASNGLVFFWAGVASINYFIRSIDILGGNAWSYAAIPCIYIFMMLIRTACLALFNVSIFAWVRERLGWAEVVFTGWAGLRGAISLIMTADFIAHSAFLQGNINDPDDPERDIDRVNSDISIWTASFVVLTLCINAPSISIVMHWLRLDRITPEKRAMRAKAKRALLRFTGAAIETLREDDEEFLQGANWEAVASYVDVSGALNKFDGAPGGGGGGGDGKDAGGQEPALARKSLVHSVSHALLAPLAPFISHLSHTGGGADGGGDATDASVGGRSQRSRGSGRRLGGLLPRASSSTHLGRATSATQQRIGTQRRRRQRSDVGARPFASGAGFSSGEDSSGTDFDESDTEEYGSEGSSRGGGGGARPVTDPDRLFLDSEGSAGEVLGEVVEECPFIHHSQQLRSGAVAPQCNSIGSEDGAGKPAGGEQDIEMGLRQPPGAASMAAAAGAVAGAATMAGAALARASGAAAAALPGGIPGGMPSVAATAASPAVVVTAPAAGSPMRAAAAAAAAPAPKPPAAAPGDEEGDEEELSAENLLFIRQLQQSQKQRRPALGSLFTPGADAEQAPPSPLAQSASGGAGAGTFYRSGSLQTITEHQQQVQPEAAQGQVGWHQQQPEGSAPASEAGGDAELYYSSMPAAVGRQLARQLHEHQLQEAAASLAAEGPAPSGTLAAGAAGSASEAPTGHTRTASSDELYYSSMPAMVGRQLAQQLHQQLQEAPEPPPRPPLPHPPPAATLAPAASSDAGASPVTAAAAVAAAGAAGASGTAAHAPPPDIPLGYYSSLPAAVGRQLGAQLRHEMAAAGGAAGQPASPHQQPALQPPAGGEDLHLGYYSSLPAAVGRQLAQQLKQEQFAAGAATAAAGAAPHQEQQGVASGQPQQPAPSQDLPAAYYSSLPAAAGRDLQRQLQQQLATSQARGGAAAAAAEEIQPAAPRGDAAGGQAAGADHYSTMPAALGRSLQRQLAEQLEAGPASEAGTSRSSSMEPGGAGTTGTAVAGGPLQRKVPPFGSSGDVRRPPRPGGVRPSPSNEALSQHPAAAAAAAAGLHAATPRPGSSRQHRLATPAPRGQAAWEDYHRTVTGAAGPSLAAEVQRQLAAQRAGAGAPSSATTAAAGPLTALPQRDLLGRKIAAGPGAGAGPGEATGAGAGLGGMMPLSARGPGHSRTPSGDAHRHLAKAWSGSSSTSGVAAVLPAATPLAAHLQMRRVRTMDRSRRRLDPGTGPASFALPLGLEGGEGGAASQLHSSREEALGALARRSGSYPPTQETSWQHKPLRAVRTMSRPTLTHASASPLVAALAEADGSPSPSPPGAVVVAVPLSHAYSGPTPSPMGGSGKHAAGAKGALSRYSYAGSANSHGSLHGGSAYATAAGIAVGTSKAASKAFLPTPSMGSAGGFSAGALSEMRSRLVAGLKRYFHAKRMEGLLSVQGMRILDYACDHAAERTQEPLGMWRLLEKEVAGNLTTRIMARCLMWVARCWRSSPRWLQAATSWPVKKVSGFLRRVLGQRMLVSCEVAVEYYLSMIHSPQIQWLQQSEEAWPLQQEVEVEVDAAYRFIIDREIEAPDRFQAIQSYRAAMAVLRQQLTFVHELFESGMVDGGEKDDMTAPLDKRMRHLEITGPVWKPPRPRTVLRGLPFMQVLPDELFRAILAAGTVKDMRTGVAFWASSDLPEVSQGEAGPGCYVVLSGVIRRIHQRPDGTTKEYYQGIGGVVGALLAITGTRLPGVETAVAEGNTLGKGPVLFHIPQSAMHLVKLRANEGDPGAALLRLQLLRMGAAFVTESCESDVAESIHLHLLQLAAARMGRALKRRPTRHSSSRLHSAAGTAPGSPRAGAGPQPEALPRLQPAPPAAPLPASSGLRRSSSLARLSAWRQLQPQPQGGTGGDDEDEDENEGGLMGRLPSQLQHLQRQAAPAPSGLRTSKSFGGHLAELMQQIAKEEFEEMNRGGGGGGGPSHLQQVEEGYEEGGPTSPGASEGGPAGSSTADLPAMAAGAGGGTPGPAANGHAEPASSRGLLSASSVPRGSGSADAAGHAVAAAAAKAARAMRHRARAAERRAPQFAPEVLAELKRGLPTGLLVSLSPGQAFTQTTHLVLLRGQLLAAGPPLQPEAGGATPTPGTPPRRYRGSDGGAETAANTGAALAGAGSGGLPAGLRRVSATGEHDWEAALAAAAAAAAAPPAPRILPWLWAPRYRFNAGAGVRLAGEQRWAAGPSGALLLACLTEGGEAPAGVAEAEAAAAAAAAAEAAAAADVEAAAALQSHPLDLSSAGSQGGQAVGAEGGEGSGRGAGTARRALRVASSVASPATRATSGFLRMMPWQHRYSRGSNSASQGGEADGGAAADGSSHTPSSGDGSGHGGSAMQQQLRVPLERLARSRPSDAAARSVHSAR